MQYTNSIKFVLCIDPFALFFKYNQKKGKNYVSRTSRTY